MVKEEHEYAGRETGQSKGIYVQTLLNNIFRA